MVHCLQWAFIEGGTSLHFEKIVLLAFHLEQLTYYFLDFPGGSDGKVPVYNAGDQGSIPGSKDPLEKEMATHPSILAWRITWTEEASGLQSMGSLKSRT